MVEALEAVLDLPAHGERVSSPVEGDAVLVDRSGEACDVGAYGSGEGDGVTPFADNVVGGAAERTHSGLVGDAWAEAADGGGMAGGGIDDVDVAAIPDVEFPSGLVANGRPIEGGSGVGDVGDGEAFGSEAGQAVGDEAVDDPAAIAEGVGRAILTHAEGVVGGRLQASEGVGVACDMDVGSGPAGGGTLLDVHLIVSAFTIPTDGGRLVGVVDSSDNGLVADGY